jgi:hypothetical protein
MLGVGSIPTGIVGVKRNFAPNCAPNIYRHTQGILDENGLFEHKNRLSVLVQLPPLCRLWNALVSFSNSNLELFLHKRDG